MNIEKLANKILKEANKFTNWGFILKSENESYVVEATMDNKRNSNTQMLVRFELIPGGSHTIVQVVLSGEEVDEDKLKKLGRQMEFPVSVWVGENNMYKISSLVPQIYMESDTIIIVREMMIQMATKMTDLLGDAKIK